MQPSHLNYIKLREKHSLSVIGVEAHNSHRTIFLKEFSFAHLAAAGRDVSSQLASTVSEIPKLREKTMEAWPVGKLVTD